MFGTICHTTGDETIFFVLIIQTIDATGQQVCDLVETHWEIMSLCGPLKTLPGQKQEFILQMLPRYLNTLSDVS